MYEDNPFLRPNPFKGLSSRSSLYHDSSFDTPSYFSNSNSDRLTRLLEMNPFMLPFKAEPILNNGIEEYKCGLTNTMLWRRKFDESLPAVSFNYFTKIGGGVIDPSEYRQEGKTSRTFNDFKTNNPIYIEEQLSLYKQVESKDRGDDNTKQDNLKNLPNLTKFDTFSEMKEDKTSNPKNETKVNKESKQQSVLSHKNSGAQSYGISINNNATNLKRHASLNSPTNIPPNNLISIQNTDTIVNTINDSNPFTTEINANNVQNSSENSHAGKMSQKIDPAELPQFHPPTPSKHEISLNDFPEAASNNLNKQIISNINEINDQNQILDYQTKYSNRSAPLAKISTIYQRQESKQSNQINPIGYPFDSLHRIPSHEEVSEEPSQITVEGNRYYRLSFKDPSKG